MAKGSVRPPQGARQDKRGFMTVPTAQGVVRVHALHGKHERRANVETATYLAEKYGYEIDLLPDLDNRKSPDAYNRTLGKVQEYKSVLKPTNNAVQLQIRSAAKQANSIVLTLKETAPLDVLSYALNDRVKRCENITDVTIMMDGKDATFVREKMIADGFMIKGDDFK